jgi:hypothetical protein
VDRAKAGARAMDSFRATPHQLASDPGEIVVAVAVDVCSVCSVRGGLTAPSEPAGSGAWDGIGIWLIVAPSRQYSRERFRARVAGDPGGDGVAHGVMVWAGFVLISRGSSDRAREDPQHCDGLGGRP